MRTATSGIAPDANINAYLLRIRAFPMLPQEEEFRLAQACRAGMNPAAAEKLVTSHLRLVAKMAMGYRGYGLPVADIIGEGNAGLVQAVMKFDPDRGFRLSTYAVWWIRAEIQQYILNNWSLVKIGTTAAQKKLFFNLRRLKSQIHAIEEGDLTPEHVDTIAAALGVHRDDVVSMNRRMGSDYSLNTPAGEDGTAEWQDLLADGSPTHEETFAVREEFDIRMTHLAGAMDGLNDRERRIIMDRRLKEPPSTLDDLAGVFNVSRERIRQIEVIALGKLRKAMISRSRRASNDQELLQIAA